MPPPLPPLPAPDDYQALAYVVREAVAGTITPLLQNSQRFQENVIDRLARIETQYTNRAASCPMQNDIQQGVNAQAQAKTNRETIETVRGIANGAMLKAVGASAAVSSITALAMYLLQKGG